MEEKKVTAATAEEITELLEAAKEVEPAPAPEAPATAPAPTLQELADAVEVADAGLSLTEPKYFTGDDGQKRYIDESGQQFLVGDDGELYRDDDPDAEDDGTDFAYDDEDYIAETNIPDDDLAEDDDYVDDEDDDLDDVEDFEDEEDEEPDPEDN